VIPKVALLVLFVAYMGLQLSVAPMLSNQLSKADFGKPMLGLPNWFWWTIAASVTASTGVGCVCIRLLGP